MKEVEWTRAMIALVDDGDFEGVVTHKWCYMTVGYAARSIVEGKKRKLVYLHRFILQPAKGVHIDHADGNKLNNQRSNLRTCTHQENMQNSRILHTNNTSGHKGEAFDK